MIPKDNISFINPRDFNKLGLESSHHPARLFPDFEDSAELSVRCFRNDYSASRIARAVEDCNANLLNLNITSEASPIGEIIVDLRISHRNIDAVARSLERYGYSVDYTPECLPDADDDDTTARRIGELLAHLNV